MNSHEVQKTLQKTLRLEKELQKCYRKMAHRIENPQNKQLFRDLLVLEEENEWLIKFFQMKS